MTETPSNLVAAATTGDEDAWAELVRRYTPLVLSVIKSYGLDRTDASDVNQTVWLRLVEHLDRIEKPAALASWLASTTQRECYRLLRLGRRTQPVDVYDEEAFESHLGMSLLTDSATPDEYLLRAERLQALREGFAQLPRRCQDMLSMLTADPPASYREISERLAMPIGSIGPTQARCLHKLRNCPAIVAFVRAVQHADGEEGDRDGIVAAGR
ncbi:RNA polymerase sigma factor [Micromonospora polyrhachis]|nr:sigma-70 family RNA polymerase sigma factor [Micromonospora polyrhachis]